MGYCSAADITADFANMLFDATTKVKAADIDSFIVDADALIDSYLAGRYVVPITGVEALKVVKLYSRTLVSDKVTGILQIKQQTNTPANQNVRSGLSTKDVIKMLEALKNGDSQLSDAALVKSAGGISSFNVREGRTPEFKKDVESW
jgi:phage gp36-like protein